MPFICRFRASGPLAPLSFGSAVGIRFADPPSSSITRTGGKKRSYSNLSLAENDEFGGGQLLHAHGAVGMELRGADADLGTEPELAAVNQVMQQYGAPINVGLVDDVDAAIEEYRQKLLTAGVESLIETIREQTIIYVETHSAE